MKLSSQKILAISGLLILFFIFKPVRLPRGLRNNNAGNIRDNSANNWLGQTGVDDKGFVIFDTHENGIRAMGKVLDSYARRGIRSVQGIISTYAPSTENQTDEYINSVSKNLGINETTFISRENGDFPALVAAMILHENGQQPFTEEFITGALALG